MKTYIQILFILLALGFATSCNEALELEYDGRTSLDELFKTRNGVRGYLNSCYGARIMPDINRATLTDESQSSDMLFQDHMLPSGTWMHSTHPTTRMWMVNPGVHLPGDTSLQHLSQQDRRVTANELASSKRNSPPGGHRLIP